MFSRDHGWIAVQFKLWMQCNNTTHGIKNNINVFMFFKLATLRVLPPAFGASGTCFVVGTPQSSRRAEKEAAVERAGREAIAEELRMAKGETEVGAFGMLWS